MMQILTRLSLLGAALFWMTACGGGPQSVNDGVSRGMDSMTGGDPTEEGQKAKRSSGAARNVTYGLSSASPSPGERSAPKTTFFNFATL